MKIRLEVKLEDLWVGAYWHTDPPLWRGSATVRRHIWICLLPCLPLHISWDVPA